MQKLIKYVLITVVSILTSINSHAQVLGQKEYNIGTQYWFANGVKEDTKKACDYFEQSANLGFPPAQFNLGNCYRMGEGRDKSINQAIYWYEQAVEKNNIPATSSLGAIYLLDEDVKNNSRAVFLLEKAAKQKNINSLFLLGYACHLEIKKNCKLKSVSYYKRAAEKGHTLSQLLLSYIYLKGLYGEKKNLEKSNYWKKAFDLFNKVQGVEGETYDSGVEYLKEHGYIPR